MRRPNFVLIMTDSQGANVVGCYGRPEMQTPNIDRLASAGIRFDRAYTACPVCTPARAAIFTGLYPSSSGAWTNDMPLGSNIKTMGQRFREGGYRTVYVGKWHLAGHDYYDAGICPDGWEEKYWFDGRRYLDSLTEAQVALWRQGLGSPEKLREHRITPEFTWAHRVSNRAIEFLRDAGDGPFLLVVSYDEPHHPYTCPPEYVERFRDFDYAIGPGAHDDLSGKPSHHGEWAATWSERTEKGTLRAPMYFGCNSFVDAEIGRVFDAADRGAGGNTYVIYTSDHGEMLGAHRLASKGPAMYEEILRIPLIVRSPRGATAGLPAKASATAGVADEKFISHVDLLPTMLDLAGIDVPPILHGRRLPLTGRRASEAGILAEFNRYEVDHDSFGGIQPIRCWMEGDYKLVINLLNTDELYNLREDPAELRNLIADPAHAGVRDRMHDALLDAIHRNRDPFRGPCWERRPWRTTRRFSWRGTFRPRPADGYAPTVLDYRTGRVITAPREN